MIFWKRKRLIIWLVRAYFKKWGKTILMSFLLGLVIFIILKFSFPLVSVKIPTFHQKSIGVVGVYQQDNLPTFITTNVSQGLTTVDLDNTIKPGLASKWEIDNDGKTYTFHLKHNLTFSDGSPFTSSSVQYNFLDVSVKRPDKYTLIFALKNSYSPFLVTVSKPIFKNNFIGIGDYKIKNIQLNGNFVQSLDVISNKNRESVSYQFFPTETALKTAFALGEITDLIVTDPKFNNSSLYSFKHVSISRNVDYDHLVTLFYNTDDRTLSDKRLREGLSYAIPDNFDEGQRNNGPFSPYSWANQSVYSYKQDLAHAKLLLLQSQSSSESGKLTLTISTLPQFKNVALKIKNSWDSVGIDTNIKIVSTTPTTFQIFLGEFNLPKDPDEYSLWHSNQTNNISNYKNLRIDKLLEDGRQTIDISDRKKIYDDFQKYLFDDPPAAFLYFPYNYVVSKNKI
jgi:peptide/nickel transport system substrate-binding protein